MADVPLWWLTKDSDLDCVELYERHYSAYRYADGRARNNGQFVGPGEKVVLRTERADALFVWRVFIDDSGQGGVNCAVFRNESRHQSSQLIRQADSIADCLWPDRRHYTYVDPAKIASTNPGFCFIAAGWRRCGRTKGGLVILERSHSPHACGATVSGAQMQWLEPHGTSHANDEWYTPSWFFEALGVEFDLDPCSPGAPPSTVPARRVFTKADNGLAREWNGCVWLNPPFSSKRQWYERLIKHGDGIALMPARTETHDLQTYMGAADLLIFMKGRIYFERGSRPGGNGVGGITTSPPFGIVLCAYGERMAEALLVSRIQGLRTRRAPPQPGERP